MTIRYKFLFKLTGVAIDTICIVTIAHGEVKTEVSVESTFKPGKKVAISCWIVFTRLLALVTIFFL